jgi:hypothetical protein
MHMPDGYMVTVSRREGSPSRHIDMDEMDAILALGKIRLIAVEDTVGDILIEYHQYPRCNPNYCQNVGDVMKASKSSSWRILNHK